MANQYSPKRVAVQLEDGTIQLPLTQEKFAIIDAVDSDLTNFNWTARKSSSNYYVGRWVNKKCIYLHRAILSRILGRELLPGEQADHINLDPLDNRRTNLRLATSTQNNTNKQKRPHCSSNLKGVSWSKQNKKWQAQINVNGKGLSLGFFDSPEQAHLIYCEAAKQYHGEFARLD